MSYGVRNASHHPSFYLSPHPQVHCKVLLWVVTAQHHLHPRERGHRWGCTQRYRCFPVCFPKWWMCSFINSLVDLLTFLCTALIDLTFANPLGRSSNKILFSQEMVSLVYLNENAVVCCFTLHWKYRDQRINTRLKIRSSFLSKRCSLCLWYANKESLNKFDNIKLVRGFKYKLSNH